MLCLVSSILLSALMTAAFKIAARRELDGDPVLLCNYVIAFAVSLARTLQADLCLRPGKGEITFLPASERGSLLLCFTVGAVMGWLYLATLDLSQKNIRYNGAAVSGFFSRSTFLGGLAAGALLWQEIPDRFQILACFCILGALLLLAGDLSALEVRQPRLLLLAFAGNTVVTVGTKAFTKYALPAYEPLFMTVVFGSALFFCSVRCRIWERSFWRERICHLPVLAVGAAVGVSNALSSSLSVLALQALPTNLVYPTESAGGLILSFLIARCLFREKGTPRETLALVIAAAGLVLASL